MLNKVISKTIVDDMKKTFQEVSHDEGFDLIVIHDDNTKVNEYGKVLERV
jgi:hypothetical protein